ncbi:unnamed protein product [Plutella xylostella]|uniref:(diamondback moth) hypothetical protein n=1 Tax=Plutella xylostella TaxID=51655 RepID=A0A8S4GAN1_PLUXY|nr:unnamed protein product [Plutella xylostella]
MARLAEAAVRMCDAGVVEALASILADERAAWFDVRINALKALGELTRATARAATALVAPKTFSAVVNVNKKYKETPVEAQRLAVQCYINLLDYHETMRALLTPQFIQDLLHILQRIDIKLKILACSALSMLMSEDPGRQLFTSKGGEKIVSENLKVEHLGLRTALCNLILASVTNAGAVVYHGIGTLHYMVTNRQARYAVSAWEAALESVFKHNPSAKFAYTGRLDVTDFTHDGFYVQKRISDRFPPLKDIVRDARRPFKDPVFVINFGKSKLASEPSHERSSSDSKVDSNLRNYLDNLLSWFGEPESSCKGSKSMQYTEVDESEYEVRYREKCHEVSTTLKSRAEQLAEFVVEQMCGLTEERDCSMLSVDLHLADLMLDLNTSVLPLGHVRCGGPLERALLYKALADRVAVPCALCRGGGGAWCEVAVPESDPDEDEIIPGTALRGYPAGLLRVNYIVDLERGRLVRAGGADAQRVCGVTCSQRYVAGKSPDECYCDALFYV